MIKMTGAQIIIHLLERQGVRLVSGIPGGANLPLYDALSQSQVIRHVLARHEQGAGFIAQGWARSTGQPGVCFATSGPGATNVLTAIADAKVDSIPIICITGQVSTALLGTDAFQEVDTYGLSLPITKHSYLVKSAGELLRVIPEAFQIAMSGRPGPVLIDVPKNVQFETCEFEKWPEPGIADRRPRFKKTVLGKAADLLNKSKRPILYLGGGTVMSGVNGLARAFAEKASLPTTMTLMGLGAIPMDHPLSLGMLGMHAARATNMALEECDLLIAAGARFDDRATGKAAEFCPKANIIHIDIDASEIHKIKPAHVGIVADAGEAIEALIPMLKQKDRSEWLHLIAQLKRDYALDMTGSEDILSPYGIIQAVSEILEDDAIITTDVGQHQMWVAQAFPFRGPRQWLTSGGLGTMGFGFPAAIGAALAHPDKTVVCFSGDGSLLMNIQEMATAAEENVNVKIVLMNNQSLGLVHQQQDLFYQKRLFACDFRTDVDFVRIAGGFHMKAVDLGKEPDPRGALLTALTQSGPCLINVPIQVTEKVFPMVPPGSPNRHMIVADDVKAKKAE